MAETAVLWHYTFLPHLESILRDGLIRPRKSSPNAAPFASGAVSEMSKSKIGSNSTAVTPSSFEYGNFSMSAKTCRRAELLMSETCKASHIHFVNDGVFDRPAQRFVSLPIVVFGINDGGAQRSGNVIRIARCINTFPERFGVSARIRIDEDLVAVVTEASLGHERTNHCAPAFSFFTKACQK